ncbi:MAG TPA: signal protein, partial [Prevotella sp.]
MINLKLYREKADQPRLQGEVNTAWYQQHHARFGERVSLNYASKRLFVDFMYKLGHGSQYDVTDEEARNSQTGGSVYNLRTHEVKHSWGHDHNYRLGIDYEWGRGHSMSMVYTGSYDDDKLHQDVSGTIRSDFQIDYARHLHNLRWDYRLPFGLSAGVEYTFYKTPETQLLNSTLPTGNLAYRVENVQCINRWKMFLAQEHGLRGGWRLNYGATYTTSSDHSSQHYAGIGSWWGGMPPADEEVRQHEDNVNVYVGASRQ